LVDEHTVAAATAFRRAVSGSPDEDDPMVKFIRGVRPTRARKFRYADGYEVDSGPLLAAASSHDDPLTAPARTRLIGVVEPSTDGH